MSLKKIRQAMNDVPSRKWNAIITTAVLCLFVAIAFQYKSNFIPPTKQLQVIITVSKITNQCIYDYYSNDLDENGHIFSMVPPPDDCDVEDIANVVGNISTSRTNEEIENMSIQLFQKMEQLNANGAFFKSCQLVNIKSGEVIKDFTNMVRPQNVYKFLDTPKSNI